MTDRKTVSVTDIAREAGVSATTVSRVLNDKHEGDIRISPKTRAHVQAVARQLGYRRNPLASALRTNRSGLVGAVSRNVSGTYMSILGHHLQAAAQARGIELLIAITQTERAGIRSQLSLFQSQLFDGVLFLGDLTNYQDVLHGDAPFQKPYVHVSPGEIGPEPLVTSDDVTGVRQALDYLIALGHRAFAFVGAEWAQDQRRQAVYREVVGEAGLADCSLPVAIDTPYWPEDLTFGERIRAATVQYARRLFDQPRHPTAVVCANDGFAADVIRTLYERGLRVPEDVSVMGYGDQHEARITAPQLTTMRLPNRAMADAALDLLVNMLEQPDDATLHNRRVFIPPELVVRGTTQSPRG